MSEKDKSLRKDKRDRGASVSDKKSRPGPSPLNARRLDNIETIRGHSNDNPSNESSSKSKSSRSLTTSALEMASSVATLQDVTQAMLLANITESDLWEGKTDIFPIIVHYGPQLLSAAMASEGSAILDVLIPSDFDASMPSSNGFFSKSYRCDPFWTVHHVVSMICKRFNLTEPKDWKKWSLTTISGFTLQDSEPLASFGLGSLLPRWQLQLQKREGRTITRIDTIKQVQKEPVSPKPASSGKKSSSSNKLITTPTEEERYPVLFLLDTSVFKYKSQRVLLRPSTSIEHVIDGILSSHRLNDVKDMVLATTSGQILDKNGILADFGLGKRFHHWQLQLLKKSTIIASVSSPSLSSQASSSPVASKAESRSDSPKKSNRSTTAQSTPNIIKASGKYAWVQVEEANLQPEEAKRIILELEKKLERAKRANASNSSDKTVSIAKEFAKLETTISTLKQEKSELERQKTEIEADFQTRLQNLTKQTTDHQNTENRLRTERDEYKSKFRDLEKQLAKEKMFFEKQILEAQTSLKETLRITSTQSKPRKSVSKAFDQTEKSNTTEQAKSEIDHEIVSGLQIELEIAKNDAAYFKNQLSHQQSIFEEQISSLKKAIEESKSELKEVSKKASKVSTDIENQAIEIDTLNKKNSNLIEQLQKEKQARIDAVARSNALEELRAKEEENQIEMIKSKLESEYEARYADLLETNRDLFKGLDEIRIQLIETGKERDELASQLQEALNKLDRDGSQSDSKEVQKSNVEQKEVVPKAVVPPAPSPPPAPSLQSTSAKSPRNKPSSDGTKSVRMRKKAQREDSVFLGLSMASRIEQGRTKLKQTKGPIAANDRKKTYQSDLEKALQRRFLAMSCQDFEDLEDEDSNSPFDEEDDSVSSNSAEDLSSASTRALFDLKI